MWIVLQGDCDVAVEGVEVLERPLYLGIEHYMKTVLHLRRPNLFTMWPDIVAKYRIIYV
jgi:hypothetical protein